MPTCRRSLTASRSSTHAIQREDGSWLVEGSLGIVDFKRRFSLGPLPGEDDDRFQSLGGYVVDRLGHIPNAGVLITGAAWDQDDQTRRLMFEVNALGTINGTVSAIGAMRGNGGGHVVNIASLAGLSAVAGEAVYAASKHAVLGFSLSTMADLRMAGVKDIDISCICPDGIWTPMLHDKLDDPASALSFSGKLLQPEDVVDVVRKVLDKPHLVTAIPAWRGLQVRFADAIPALGLRAVPLVIAQGRRAQRKLAAKGSSPI